MDDDGWRRGDLDGDGMAAVAECEQVLWARDAASGAAAIVVLHDTSRGPAYGGIRRRAYDGPEAAIADAVALATAMTWKCALAELEAGGGKIVLCDRPGIDRAAAYAFVGRLVERFGGQLHTGPDVGTTDADLLRVAEHTRHCATPAHGDIAASTAAGVFAAIAATAAHAGLAVPGLRALVQGVGAVGSRLCALLAAAGCELLVADVDDSAVAAVVAAHGARAVDPDAIAATPCDVFVPCALGGVLDDDFARRLRARAVCGAANNVLASVAAGRTLHRRGIAIAPDFVANAGGLVHGVHFDRHGTPPPPARLARIGAVVAELLAQSRRDDVPPGELALQRARQRVGRAEPRSTP